MVTSHHEAPPPQLMHRLYNLDFLVLVEAGVGFRGSMDHSHFLSILVKSESREELRDCCFLTRLTYSCRFMSSYTKAVLVPKFRLQL